MNSEAYDEMLMEDWLMEKAGLIREVAHDLIVRDRHHTMNRRNQLKNILLQWR